MPSFDQYGIKPAGCVVETVLLEIMFRAALQFGQFGRSDAAGGAAETAAFAVFYFNE